MLDPLLSDKENVSTVINIACALVPSPALLVFVSRPELFATLDTVHAILILSAVGLGVLVVWMFAVLMVREASIARRRRVQRRDQLPLTERVPLQEWPALSIVAGYANLYFLLVTVWAYWHQRVRIGATLVLTSIIVLGAALVMCGLISFWPLHWTNPTIEQQRKAADLISQSLKAQKQERGEEN